MKQTSLFILTLLLLIVLLVSCQSQQEAFITISDSQNTSENTKNSKVQILDAYRPTIEQMQEAITVSKKKEIPTFDNQDSQSHYLAQTLQNLQGMAIDYTITDLNKDGQEELLIGKHQKILAIYYLNKNQRPILAVSAGKHQDNDEHRIINVCEDGTIILKHFTGQSTTVQASSYRIENHDLISLKTISYDLSNTTDPASLLGLEHLTNLDSSSLTWHPFN